MFSLRAFKIRRGKKEALVEHVGGKLCTRNVLGVCFITDTLELFIQKLDVEGPEPKVEGCLVKGEILERPSILEEGEFFPGFPLVIGSDKGDVVFHGVEYSMWDSLVIASLKPTPKHPVMVKYISSFEGEIHETNQTLRDEP